MTFAGDTSIVSCAGKVRHASRADAERCIRARRKGGRLGKCAGRANMHSYRCKQCDSWHVGGSPL